MTADDQTRKLSYIARCLITDLRDLYAEECFGRQVNEERALQLILDAFEQAAPVLMRPEPDCCPYCLKPVVNYTHHVMADECEAVNKAIKQLTENECTANEPTDPAADQEQCSHCGEWYPVPVAYYHTEAECLSNMQLDHVRSAGPTVSH